MRDETGESAAARLRADCLKARAGAIRVRWGARLTALVLAAVSAWLWGVFGLAGALLGGAVVEINLGLLARFLGRAADWRGRSLWPTLGWYYLTFGATVAACVLVIRNHWGHPLAFLLGLMSFFLGLVLAVLSYVVRRPEGDS